MEGCSKTCVGTVPALPENPLVEILSRVKCVSKVWSDLIAHPDHRKKLRQAMQGLFVQSTEVKDDGLNCRTSFSFSFIDLTLGSVPLDIDPGFSFLMEMTGIKTYASWIPATGLSFSGTIRSRLISFTIPCATRPQSNGQPCPLAALIKTPTCTYLAFDPAASTHFHLVQFQRPFSGIHLMSLHVYSSEVGTWSQNQIDEQNEQGDHKFTLAVGDRASAFVNGFLHLIVFCSDGRHILVVDIQGKVRRMITLPGMADGSEDDDDDSQDDDDDISSYFLDQSHGHLHYVTLKSWKEKISIWVLQDYDTQEWVLKNSVNSVDVFGNRKQVTVFDVVDIHQDCNVVFFIHRWRSELIAYNMDSKEVSVIATFIEFKSQSEFARYIPYFSESPALTNKHFHSHPEV